MVCSAPYVRFQRADSLSRLIHRKQAAKTVLDLAIQKWLRPTAVAGLGRFC
jgi:hypothetical protein